MTTIYIIIIVGVIFIFADAQWKFKVEARLDKLENGL